MYLARPTEDLGIDSVLVLVVDLVSIISLHFPAKKTSCFPNAPAIFENRTKKKPRNDPNTSGRGSRKTDQQTDRQTDLRE